MDYSEEQRLRIMYEEELSDEALIELALADRDDYQEGVYDLIFEAIKKRGLELELTNQPSEGNVEVVSHDGMKWIDMYHYFDEMIQLRLEAFFKELDIVYEVFPHRNRFGQLTGKGTIKVREDCVEQAEKIIVDFEDAQEFPQVFVDEQLIKDSINSVLIKNGIEGSDKIAEDIVAEIRENSSKE